jgi:hypothetical protein
MLRADVLNGRAVALADSVRDRIRSALEDCGARIEVLEGAHQDEDAAAAWARERAPLHALVFEASRPFGEGFLDDCWVAVRAVATGALIPDETGGKVILIGPPPDSSPMAGPCRAALENLARTLSIEWARYGVTATMLAPGPASTDEELGALVAYLASPAGDYFSGCRFELGSV